MHTQSRLPYEPVGRAMPIGQSPAITVSGARDTANPQRPSPRDGTRATAGTGHQP